VSNGEIRLGDIYDFYFQWSQREHTDFLVQLFFRNMKVLYIPEHQ
jgi:hypothetical protein